jgi:hypothetical protein
MKMVELKPDAPPEPCAIVLGGSDMAMVQEDGTVLVPEHLAEDPVVLERIGFLNGPKKAKKKKEADAHD